MKLVIDIDKDDYNFIKRHRNSGLMNHAETIIVNATPLDQVLEEIKGEIQFEDSIRNGMVMSTDIYKHCIDIINNSWEETTN